MNWEQIATGNRDNISSIADYESGYIAEGQHGRVEFDFLTPIPTFQVDWLRNYLTSAGVQDLEVKGGGNTIAVSYRKGFAWIPLIIAAVLTLAIVLVSWFFFREVMAMVPSWAKGIVGPAVIFGGLAVVGLIAYAYLKR